VVSSPSPALGAPGRSAALKPAPPSPIGLALVGQLGGPTFAVAAADRLAFVGVGPKLVAIDISDPERPAVRGQSEVLPGVVWDIAWAPPYAYVLYTDREPAPDALDARGARTGLAVFHAGDASRPRLVALWDDWEAVVGDRLDVPPRPDDPEPPPVLSAVRVVEAEGRLYLATTRGVVILDVFPSREPRLAGVFPTPEQVVWDVAVINRRAYLATTGTGLRILDVADPSHPQSLSCGLFFDFGGEASSGGGRRDGESEEDACVSLFTSLHGTRVIVRGGWAFLSLTFSGFVSVDIADPTHPTIGTFFDTPPMAVAGGPGNQLFKVQRDGDLVAIDVSDPRNPVQRGSGPLAIRHATRLAVAWPHVLVAAGTQGLRIADVADAEVIREVGAVVSPAAPRAIDVAGGHAYLLDEETGLQIVDARDPVRARKVGSYAVPGGEDVVVAGDRAYVLTFDDTLRVVDIAQPSRPREIGAIRFDRSVLDVAVAGRTAFVSGFFGNEDDDEEPPEMVRVIDVTDPRAPLVVGALPRDRHGQPSHLRVAGNRLYALSESALRIFDVAEAARPRRVGTYFLPRGNVEVYDLAVAGDRAYIADGPTGVLVVDLAEPRNPVEIGVLTGVGLGALRVTAWGRHAIVASPSIGTTACGDGDSPAGDGDSPAGGGCLPDPGAARYELRVLEVSDPSRARTVGRWRPVGYRRAESLDRATLAVVGDTLYVADASTGLSILRILAAPPVYLPAAVVARP